MIRSRALLALAVLALAAPGALAETPSQLLTRSYTLEAQGKYADALTALETISGSFRNSYLFSLRRGWLCYCTRKHSDAITHYQRAGRLSSRALEPILGLMLPQLALGRWKDLETTAGRALRLDPRNKTAQGQLAYAYYMTARYPLAERYYRKVLTLYPSDADIRAGLGWSLLKQGNRAAASSEFRRVLEIYPGHKTASQGLKLVQP